MHRKSFSIYGLVFILGAILGLTVSNKTEVEVRPVYIDRYVKIEEELSAEAFMKEVKRLDFKYPDIIHNQVKWESGFNTQHPSIRLRRDNNMFGMRVPNSRTTTALNKDKPGEFAIYKSWRESLLDRKYYEISEGLHKKSREQYLKYLNKNYAEVKDYDSYLIR